MRRPRVWVVWTFLLELAAVPLLAASLQQRAAELVAKNDLQGIRTLGPAVLPELARLYESGPVDRRVAIAGIWYQLGWRSKEAEKALLRDVRVQDPTLRVAVQYALGKVSGDPGVVATLLDIMRHDPNPHFRDKAACALTYDQPHLREDQKVLLYEKLIEALSDPEPQVQAIADLALNIRTGQSKGFQPGAPPEKNRKSIEAWKKWLADCRANL